MLPSRMKLVLSGRVPAMKAAMPYASVSMISFLLFILVSWIMILRIFT